MSHTSRMHTRLGAVVLLAALTACSTAGAATHSRTRTETA